VKSLVRRLLGPANMEPTKTAGAAADERKIDWKARAGDAIARVKALESELKHEAKRVEKLKGLAEKLQQRDAELEKLRDRLATAERELSVAREHLMAVEVKLDILEGAANVLDARTRSVIRPQPRETGAPV
jgi:chromosome segregation ATPase